ncbi:Transcriptional regulatory protein sin3, partial [Ascosphaera acerosa]
MAAGVNARVSPGMGTSRMPDSGRMPPMGQFHVKETKETKKRQRGAGAAAAAAAANANATTSAASLNVPAGVPMPLTTPAMEAARIPPPPPVTTSNKRAKTAHKAQAAVVETVPATPEPTLIPALPEPIPPTFSFAPSSEEYAFFDRVKKFIGNKQMFGEFLKLCNLYSADLLDKNVLVNRAQGFIGANPEIMAWFRRFMHVDPADELIEPQARAEAASVSAPVTLAHCRALGPSYRLLPKRERTKPCSGRDELCQSVLNDEWASHPTWESEDSGFVAHRKNAFEDALHRIEEDRHEYDHHIEGCVRTIQLMEPLVQQLAGMTATEVANFRLPPGLGGQSEVIYRRVIKKVYDRQVGEAIIAKMFENP